MTMPTEQALTLNDWIDHMARSYATGMVLSGAIEAKHIEGARMLFSQALHQLTHDIQHCERTGRWPNGEPGR